LGLIIEVESSAEIPPPQSCDGSLGETKERGVTMEVFGFFLFLAMVLYLVDKNDGWPKFERALKALGIVGLIAIFAGSGYSYWSNRHQRVMFDMSKAVPIPQKGQFSAVDLDPYAATAEQDPPETLPANFAGWDKPLTPDQFMAQQVVPMFAPDGSLRDVPSDRVNDAIAAGGHVAVWKKDRKGKWCLTPPLPSRARLDECGR
jgi:hypothetical protein